VVKLLSIAALACLIILCAAPVMTTEAQSPTATPTLLPIQPTATGVYQYLRPTPTMWHYGTPVAMNLNIDSGQLADEAINLYNYANRDHVIDLIGTGALVLIVVGLLINTINRHTKDND